MKSKKRYGSFSRVFKRKAGSPFERGLARLCVLVEDLRLESHGVGLEPGVARTLEEIGSGYRMQYFLRRATCTLVEFQDALYRLVKEPEFKRVDAYARQRVPRDYVDKWLPAMQFFAARKRLLKTIRNDVGGHFGREAARKAFAALPDDCEIGVEIQLDSEGRSRVLLPCAYEIAGGALLAHLPGSGGTERTKALDGLVAEGVQHAFGAVYFLVAMALWDRMG